MAELVDALASGARDLIVVEVQVFFWAPINNKIIKKNMTIQIYKGDLPDNVTLKGSLAIDTETTGLNMERDRLCLVQIATEDQDVHMVHFPDRNYDAPNLKKLLKNNSSLKIFHYARFDVAIIYKYLGIMIKNIYCTKIASKIARTYTDSHGLKDLCRELLNTQISKQQQSSYWGNKELSQNQLQYAANDVLHLHQIKTVLDEMLTRENRKDLVDECLRFIELIVKLDLNGWNGPEIFAYRTIQ